MLNEIEIKVNELNRVLERFTSEKHSCTAKLSEINIPQGKSRKLFFEVVERHEVVERQPVESEKEFQKIEIMYDSVANTLRISADALECPTAFIVKGVKAVVER